jgi:hypothetical protein
LKLFLDFKHRTATQVTQYIASPSQQALVEGSTQQLPDGHYLVGWGSPQPYFTEFTANGRQILIGRFVDSNASYRIYRFPWYGTPRQPPAIAVSVRSGRMTVYVSWNGATSVRAWRVLAGRTPSALRPVTTTATRGFETTFSVHAERYVAVQGLDTNGRVLGQSATVATS